MAKNLTPWFPGHIKPVRKGVYQTKNRWTNDTGYQHWNGRFWGGFNYTERSALYEARHVSNYQNKAWRGLSGNPKGNK